MKFAREIAEGRVSLALGDSAVVLPEVISLLEGPTVFWLDAHYQGEEAVFSAENCPLNREIATIKTRGRQDDVILIDDLRLLVDPAAWRGHNVKIDAVIGDLLLAFENHVAVRIDGHTPRDVVALVPRNLAEGFCARLDAPVDPLAAAVAGNAGRSLRTPGDRQRPALIVSSGGNNARLGNLLPVYGRLLAFANRLGRRLAFPFLEHNASQVFDLVSREMASGEAETPGLIGRIVRSAEEILEERFECAPYKYPADVPHLIDLPTLGARVICGRGAIDWLSQDVLDLFDTDANVILKDPYPFRIEGRDIDADLTEVARMFRPKAPLVDRIRAEIGKDAEGELDICFHVRQGDFRRWDNGSHFYDADTISEIAALLHDRLDSQARPYQLTIVSDEPLPDGVALRPEDRVWSADLPSDFYRLALADVVLSNGSTFSPT